MVDVLARAAGKNTGQTQVSDGAAASQPILMSRCARRYRTTDTAITFTVAEPRGDACLRRSATPGRRPGRPVDARIYGIAANSRGRAGMKPSATCAGANSTTPAPVAGSELCCTSRRTAPAEVFNAYQLDKDSWWPTSSKPHSRQGHPPGDHRA